MSGKAIGLSMGFGFAGGYSRTPDSIITAKPLASNSANVPFGRAVALKTDNTYASGSTVTLTTANFAGVAVAEVKQLNTYLVGQDQSQAGYYAANEMTDVIQRGIVSVQVVHGTPTAGGAVYVRKVLNGAFPDEAIGDFRADADSTNTIDVSAVCTWNTGLVDPNGIAELKIKTINN